MNGITQAGAVAGAVGCGVAGGVFFAFSSFVMDALRRLPHAEGITAMQAVNRQAVTPVFMATLFGTAALCAVLAVLALRHREAPASGWVLAGAVLYLVGAIGVTAVRNVPLNDALAALDPAAPASAGRWNAYLRDWTRWNHVRAVASAAAAAAMTVGVRIG